MTASVHSTASHVDDYLHALPADRCATVGALRALILAHLPTGYVETMNWGMPNYEVPLSVRRR